MLLCSDLDRTLLPNGPWPESPQARPLLHKLCAREDFYLVYVSGRNLELLRGAIADYGLPLPAFAIGDVGTTIYGIQGDKWTANADWGRELEADWNGAGPDDLAALFSDLTTLKLQSREQQNRFKLSYYTSYGIAQRALLEEMQQRLDRACVRARLIWSVDEELQIGLVDVIPAAASKLHAIEFLLGLEQMSADDTVFAGDSGNDLQVVGSGRLNSVLVRNAHAEVIDEARASLDQLGAVHRLYVANGGFLGMNGNYGAGVLEGLAHYHPQIETWLAS